jgi:hypothetical protein
MEVILEDTWNYYEEAEDIILYCNDNNIKCTVLSRQEISNMPDFFNYIFFCSTNIVYQKLKEHDCLNLCPDTYENVYNEFYCRKIEKVKVNEIKITGDIFIKPCDNDKLFDGFIAKTQQEIDNLKYLDCDIIVYKSNVIHITSEYRLLIGNMKLYGSACIKCEKHVKCDKDNPIETYIDLKFLDQLIELTGENFRCIDIGFDGKVWFIIEINPPYALDDYDMNIKNYMEFCIDSCIFINKQVEKISQKNQIVSNNKIHK